MFIMGFVFPGVDNWAHGGGFVGGYVTAQILAALLVAEGIVTYLGAGICMLSTIAPLLQLFAVWGLI